jgi:histidyl-tRNA synthetase
MQCDFDIVGTDAVSADLEIITMIYHSLRALDVPGVKIHLSHRGVFNRLLETLGIGEHSESVLRIVDKLRKVGAEQTERDLSALTHDDAARRILAFISATGETGAVIAAMEELLGGPVEQTERLQEIAVALEQLGIAEHVTIDPSITRGLDY